MALSPSGSASERVVARPAVPVCAFPSGVVKLSVLACCVRGWVGGVVCGDWAREVHFVIAVRVRHGRDGGGGGGGWCTPGVDTLLHMLGGVVEVGLGRSVGWWQGA